MNVVNCDHSHGSNLGPANARKPSLGSPVAGSSDRMTETCLTTTYRLVTREKQLLPPKAP
jgi:hypothetical protein